MVGDRSRVYLVGMSPVSPVSSTPTQRSPVTLPFTTDEGFGSRATLGMVVLASDRTLENEIRQLPLPGVALHHSRIFNETHVDSHTLMAMKARLPEAAGLLPSEFGFSAIGYGCTSASTLMGDDAVAEAIHTAHPGVSVTNPVRAAVHAFRALNAHKIAIVTPYSEAVTLPVIERFEADGFEVPAFGSFLIEDDLVVARVSADSVATGAATVLAQADADAVFISCTSIRLFDHVQRLEDELGVPVVSSNTAFTWHLLRSGGIDDQFPEFGKLLSSH